MAQVTPAAVGPLDYGVASFVLPGNQVSGDLAVVQFHEHGALVGVIDGLGHGETASLAAEKARRVIVANAHKPIVETLQHCHQELRLTRGVVVSLAAIDFARRRMQWVGVGNVQALLCRADPAAAPRRIELLLRSGVVGVQLPALQCDSAPMRENDMLILATDGLRRNFADGLDTSSDALSLARRILATHRRGDDDALVLVARMT
jgi:serine/threonine protein phosphatase PrpC